MGLRKFSIREFLKKNFDFVMGILSEVGLAVMIIVVSMLISLVLVFAKLYL